MVSLRIPVLLLGLLLAHEAFGQAAPAPERLYQVELVVFAFEGDRSRFHAAPGMDAPRSRGAVRLRSVPEQATFDAGDEERLFELLPVEALSLSRVQQRLDQASETRVLAHLGWRQPMFGFGSGRRVAIDPVGLADGGQLAGTAALLRGRFINLELDLVLTEPPDPWTWSDTGDGAAPLRYRLRERRQLRLGETHYFDHGAFGVIARVERWLRPEELAGPEDGE